MKIELSPEILVYTGRVRGREDRKRFKLKDLDRDDSVVELVVPSTVYTMTSSYFLELLGESIRLLGRDGFVRKYRINAPEHVARKVDDWIARALREKKGLFGGDI
jgi:hypothetical protein